MEQKYTMILVLVKPFVAIISQQLVLAKGCIHKAVHKRRGQVHAGRVHLRATAPKPCRRGREKEDWFKSRARKEHSMAAGLWF